jgi:hypothetical protein
MVRALDRYIRNEESQIAFELTGRTDSTVQNLLNTLALRKRAERLGSGFQIMQAEALIATQAKEVRRAVVNHLLKQAEESQ